MHSSAAAAAGGLLVGGGSPSGVAGQPGAQGERAGVSAAAGRLTQSMVGEHGDCSAATLRQLSSLGGVCPFLKLISFQRDRTQMLLFQNNNGGWRQERPLLAPPHRPLLGPSCLRWAAGPRDPGYGGKVSSFFADPAQCGS